MEFDLSEDQKMLVDTVQSFVRKDSPVERFRKLRDTELGWDKEVWKQMGELGWLGVMFPESVGGFGMSFVDAGLILEQLGTTLVPETDRARPSCSAAWLSGTPASDAQQEEFLAPDDRRRHIAGAGLGRAAGPLQRLRRQDQGRRRAAAATRSAARRSGCSNGHAADHIDRQRAHRRRRTATATACRCSWCRSGRAGPPHPARRPWTAAKAALVNLDGDVGRTAARRRGRPRRTRSSSCSTRARRGPAPRAWACCRPCSR